MRVADTNEGLLAKLGVECVIHLVWRRLWRLSVREPASPLECVEEDLMDYVRVFIKNELHHKNKVDEGRMRLIMSISVIDQLVERVLCVDQNMAEISCWESIPSKPGMGLHDEALAKLIEGIKKIKNPVSSDVSGFDWSVRWWMLELDAHMRADLAGASGHSRYRRLLLRRAYLLSASVLMLSDGEVWAQIGPGVQKSGSYNTSSTNSRIRWFLAAVAGADRADTMGDDCVESYCEQATQRYLEMGLQLKQYDSCDLQSGVGFCGHIIRDKVELCVPERWERLAANLLQTRPATRIMRDEMLCQIRHELRHSPQLGFVEALVVQSGWLAA